MTKYFNLSRYQELLEVTRSRESLVFDETFLELLDYEASIKKQITYIRKKDYLLLIEEYLNRMLEPYEFQSKFLEMDKQDAEKSSLILDDFVELENFILMENLDSFSMIMNQFHDFCFEYNSGLEEYIGEMSEEEFYDCVNNRYLAIQKSFVLSNNLTYEKLISRSFKILAEIIGLGIALIFFNI